MSKFGVVLLTLNAEKYLDEWLAAFRKQSCVPDVFCVVDSESTDNTIKVLNDSPDIVHSIHRGDFNHGSTRNLAVELVSTCDVVVFLTQDAFLSGCDSLCHLLAAFNDDKVAVAYGRQLPRDNAGLIESHARLSNYPDHSRTYARSDIPRYGFKTAFNSNSFAAYRIDVLKELGGFPENVILGEDFYVAARALENGWRIKYVAEAKVKHSHDYTVFEEGRRYFDIGVFHATNQWLFDFLGTAGGAGKKFVVSQFRYLSTRAAWLIPEAIFRTMVKLVFYKMGLLHERLPKSFVKMMSMHKFFWKGQ